MSFQELGLAEALIKATDAAGFKTPTPIQQQAIPMILAGHDLRASAQTGTGKTAAFLLPALHKLTTPSPKKKPRILILVPTRELALQVSKEAAGYAKHLSKVKTVCVYGGVPYPPQNRDLARPHEILVATPGRLIDHMESGRVDLSNIELFILDEADRMLDMGFVQPVELIASKLPKHQTLLFSATLSKQIIKLSNELLNAPEEIEISANKIKHTHIEQKLHRTHSQEHKYDLLSSLLSCPTLDQAIVFTATKRRADNLAERLSKEGKNSRALHGGMNQRQRTRTLDEMRKSKFNILIATDVAARGLDIDTITHVINYDLPKNPEDYVHRIGRTGRADKKGLALSLISKEEMALVRQIEKFTGNPFNLDNSGVKQENKAAPKKRPFNKFRPKSKSDAPKKGKTFNKFGAKKKNKHPFSFPKGRTPKPRSHRGS